MQRRNSSLQKFADNMIGGGANYSKQTGTNAYRGAAPDPGAASMVYPSAQAMPYYATQPTMPGPYYMPSPMPYGTPAPVQGPFITRTMADTWTSIPGWQRSPDGRLGADRRDFGSGDYDLAGSGRYGGSQLHDFHESTSSIAPKTTGKRSMCSGDCGEGGSMFTDPLVLLLFFIALIVVGVGVMCCEAYISSRVDRIIKDHMAQVGPPPIAKPAGEGGEVGNGTW